VSVYFRSPLIGCNGKQPMYDITHIFLDGVYSGSRRLSGSQPLSEMEAVHWAYLSETRRFGPQDSLDSIASPSGRGEGIFWHGVHIGSVKSASRIWWFASQGVPRQYSVTLGERGGIFCGPNCHVLQHKACYLYRGIGKEKCVRYPMEPAWYAWNVGVKWLRDIQFDGLIENPTS